MGFKNLGKDCDGDCKNCDLDKLHNVMVYTINVHVADSTKEKMQILYDYIAKHIKDNPDYKDVAMSFSGGKALRVPIKGPRIIAISSPEELEEVLKSIGALKPNGENLEKWR